jgi:serine/threonine protein kinase
MTPRPGTDAPDRWSQLKELFNAALDRPREERLAFIRQSCPDNLELRRELESLLSSHDAAGTFLETPLVHNTATAASDPRRSLLPPGTRLGPYEVVGNLGEGGMGEVYEARDTRLNRLVAIKVLGQQVALDADRRGRFEREARAIAALNHPHICTLHDVGQQEGTDFLVMELLAGQTLAERLKKGPLPLPQALTYGIQIAAALDKAHQEGIIHRDLKPANIMLTKDGAKLLDFGIAKLRGVKEGAETRREETEKLGSTGEGVILGTLNYMAPEQLEGKRVDPRADIFAFGAVVFEMITGRKAFDGDSQPSIIQAVLHSDPPAVSSMQPATSLPLDRVVKRCFAKDPDERWQTARDLVAELEWIAETYEAAAARAVTRPQRRNSWRRVAVVLLPFVAAAAALAAWNIVRLPSHRTTPVVILMDSPLPERVYDPDTRKNGGTNADDLTDGLRHLPVELRKETASASWHREDQVLRQNPALIVMHLSSFADSIIEVPDQPHRHRDAVERMRAFLGYVGLGNDHTKFLVYTRYTPAEFAREQWIAETETRFPSLKGRIAVMHVPGGNERATFRDPATAGEIERHVKSALDLP